MSNITMQQAAAIQPYLKKLGSSSGISEYVFPNIYLFRHVHNYELTNIDGFPCLSGISYDKKSYIMPLLHPQELPTKTLKKILTSNDFLYPMAESWLPWFDPTIFTWTASDDDSDYVFAIEKTAAYSGRKLHNKKNLLNQFVNSYEGTERQIGQNDLETAIKLLDLWLEQSGQSMEETDYTPCREGIELMDELGLEGWIFFAGNEPAGFLLGEGLTSDTFVIHSLKGNTSFKGVYPYMLNALARHMGDRYMFFNLEQDIGKKELRQSKRSYRPAAMIKKYRITLLDEESGA